MAYRNGTYIAFHAEGTNIPIDTDMKYYRLLCAWHENENIDFRVINSHEKTNAVRDKSKAATLRASLLERLRNSRNMVLVVGDKTRFDVDWVPFEIERAVDHYKIPIIAAYPGFDAITGSAQVRHLWPPALTERINAKTGHVIHIPFKQTVLKHTINKYDHDNLPIIGSSFYSSAQYEKWNKAAT